MNKFVLFYTWKIRRSYLAVYIKAISDFHNQKITLISRPTTHAKILYKDYIDEIILILLKKNLLFNRINKIMDNF